MATPEEEAARKAREAAAAATPSRLTDSPTPRLDAAAASPSRLTASPAPKLDAAAATPSRLTDSPTPRLDALRQPSAAAATPAPAPAKFPNNLYPNNAVMTGTGGLVAAPATPSAPAIAAVPAPTAAPAMATAPAPAPRFATPEEASNLAGRRELFADMRATAKGVEGSKTGSDFRDRAKALGIDDAGYARGIGRAEGTLPMASATPPLGGLKQAYSNYKANEPMQSTSSLSGSIGKLGETRTLGTQSGAMRREARRLRKQGYTAQAGEMAGAASMQRLNEPRILTQEQRGRMGEQARQADAASAEAAALQSEYTQFMRDALKRRRGEL